MVKGFKKCNRISVVIPARNSKKTIKECIQSLKNQLRKPDEIIVVDDGSKDNTSKIAKEEKVKVIRSHKSNGRSTARNIGIKSAENEVIAFLDSDSIADSKWLYFLEKKLKQFDIVSDRRSVYNPDNWYTKSLQANYDIIYSNNYSPKCGWIMKKSIIKIAGAFDSTIYAGEEHELGKRIINKKIIIGFASQAIQYHNGPPRNLFEGLKRSFIHNKLKSKYFRKHPETLPYKQIFFLSFSLIFFALSLLSTNYFLYFCLFNMAWFLGIVIHQGIIRRGFYRVSYKFVFGLSLIRFFEHFSESLGAISNIVKFYR